MATPISSTNRLRRASRLPRGAEHALEDNPDRAEIMSDLEQAIADKCQSSSSPHKSVVTTAEVEEIVEEMGPVDGGTAGESGAGAAADQQAAPGGAGPRPGVFIGSRTAR